MKPLKNNLPKNPPRQDSPVRPATIAACGPPRSSEIVLKNRVARTATPGSDATVSQSATPCAPSVIGSRQIVLRPPRSATCAAISRRKSRSEASRNASSSGDPPRRFFNTLQVDGVQRSALVNVPAAAPVGTPLPVVVMYHGAGSTGPETERTIGLTPVGDHFGFVAVYPDANGPWWDIRHGPNAERVGSRRP